jgi:hypothetical protein
MKDMAALARLQREINREWQAMTPKQKAQYAKALLPNMEGQQYLLGSGNQSH